MRRHELAGALFVLLACNALVFAQKLPRGEYHRNRERSYDLLHYKSDIQFEFENHRVLGKAAIRLTPLHTLDSFSLDAIGLNVKNVTQVEANSSLSFRTEDNTLNISLPQSKTPNDTFTVIVEYDCHPQAGMYFRRNPENPKLFYVTTYGEDGLHANWLPIYNDVNDRFSTEMIVTVPDPYVVISNGKLVSSEAQAGGQKVYHWLQTLPHSNYLIALYVGDFEKGDLASAFGTIPLSFWVPRGKLGEGRFAFRNTTQMVEFFSNRFGYQYPWDKYDQIAVPDYAIGAMEHTGVTGHRATILREKTGPLEFDPNFESYYDNWTVESLISHELAHHWFGNNLTCRNLSYIWLNESFASYLMMLWDEESAGKDLLGLDLVFAKRQYFNFVRNQHMIRPLEYHYFDDSNTIYNTEHTYLKGAVVLHMLRKVLGEESFFRALSHYLHKHEFSSVVSEDLKIAIEEATGTNLDWFFEQWITGAGHPIFEASYRYLPGRKLISLAINQVQPLVEGQGIFTLPVKLTIATPGKTWQEEVWIENESEDFLFSSDEKPLMISFDGEGDLVAEIRFNKSMDELIYQANHDALPGKMWALQQLANRYPVDPRTVKALASIIITSKEFWGVRAEAATMLGAVRTPAAEEAVAQAMKSSDYQVRKAAVLALAKFGTVSAEQKLRQVISQDANTNVAGAAIVALAQANPKHDPTFFKAQLGRKSWYDEITIACLRAFRARATSNAIADLKPYTQESHNQHMVEAALLAWEVCAPEDKELHRTLMSLTSSPVYALQQLAINMLGRLHVAEANATLNEIVAQDADDNLTVAAKNALNQINRVERGTN